MILADLQQILAILKVFITPSSLIKMQPLVDVRVRDHENVVV